MSVSEPKRGRTNPADLEKDSSDEEGEAARTITNAAVQKYRAKVKTYQQPNQFPITPLYGVNEIVYLVIQGQNQPAGPFIVVNSLDDKRYRLKDQTTGVEHPVLVFENQLVVPAN